MDVKDINTLEDLARAIDELRGIGKNDDESAHGMEDGIMVRVMELIAQGSVDPVAAALLALTMRDIDFARWCA